jgi:OHCU decarboxylase
MKVSELSRAEFVERFGGVYEHSPQFAERVWDNAPPAALDDPAQLKALFRRAVETAGKTEHLALIRAHPDLGDRLALSPASSAEQQGAGLDQCSPAEFAAFQSLNGDYKAKFGFPFIIAVRGLERRAILEAFRARLDNKAEAEFQTALEQIHAIAAFRIGDLLADPGDKT